MSPLDQAERTLKLLSVVKALRLHRSFIRWWDAGHADKYQKLLTAWADREEVDPESLQVSDIRGREFLQKFHHMMVDKVFYYELDKFEVEYKEHYPKMVNLAKAFFEVSNILY
jgi:hypothetical protein